MKPNHTPGPWALDNPASLIVRAPARHAASQRIADCRALLPDAELRANAALIAAAPELLAALQALAAVCENEGFPYLGNVLPKARAAIAKATGADHA